MSIFKPIRQQEEDKIKAGQIEKLIDKKVEEKINEKKTREKDGASIAQQLLILHYLDLIDKIELPTIRKAKLLAILLNKNIQDIKVGLTYIDSRKIKDSDIKTEKNLEVVLEIFKSLKMPDAIELVTKDLHKRKSL
jgi:hypothetical protein